MRTVPIAQLFNPFNPMAWVMFYQNYFEINKIWFDGWKTFPEDLAKEFNKRDDL